jgi:hypothetical protein
MVADMLKVTDSLDILPIGLSRLQLTVMQVVSGVLQSTKTFPSVDCDGSGPDKLVALLMDLDLKFPRGSSEIDALLPSVVFANIDVLPLSVVSS